MRIIWAGSGWNFDFACSELKAGYQKILPQIVDVVFDEFRHRPSSKTLVVIRSCPCCGCSGIREYDSNEFVVVTPLEGIDAMGYKVARPEVCPSFRNPGVDDECKTEDDFIAAWSETIENAIRDAEATEKNNQFMKLS
jgi:hypothetical protein